MKASSDGGFFAEKVEPSRRPIDVELHLRFPKESEEARFDFTFASESEAPVALPEFRVPGKAEDIYQEIVRRDERIRDLIRRGAWPDLYIPALEAKDLVLALVEKEGRRVERPAKKLVRAAWLLDTHGDRGNRREVETAYRLFEEAIHELAEVEALAN